jgi:murein DD-endopeptidase MepM/ murein hydrolase activator NlpD
MAHPIPGLTISTPYGRRSTLWSCDQVAGKGVHTGDDYSTKGQIGFPVHATAGGKVIIVTDSGGWGDSFGLHVVVDSGERRHGYCHLSKSLVSVGDRVQASQQIGLSGRSGHVTGPHLHYEERVSPFTFCAGRAEPILNRGGPGPGTTLKVGTVRVSELCFGTRDSDSVRRLQDVLNGMGITGTRLRVTGNYDAETRAEVRRWQRVVALQPEQFADGNLGPLQAKLLFAGSRNRVVTAPVAPQQPVAHLDPPPVRRHTGPAVRVVVQVGHKAPRQPGHVGATGAAGELEMVEKIGAELVRLLRADPRFRVQQIPGRIPAALAQEGAPVDAFIALHCDGSGDKSVDWWSLGFPPHPTNKKLADLVAAEFKAFHRSARRPDNNTDDMRSYYAWDVVRTAGPEVLVEHGFVSNPDERRWMNDHVADLAAAEHRALVAYFGLDEPRPTPDDDVEIVGFTVVRPARPLTVKTRLLSPPRATADQLASAVLQRPHGDYSEAKVRQICELYADVATDAGMDPLVVVAQMVLETGNLSSFWSQPPRRNPAGIGVTGEPGEGLSFRSWPSAVRAHVGRLLAYAMVDADAKPPQRALIDEALAARPLPGDRRASARTLRGLSGNWAADPAYAGKIALVANGILGG